MPTALAGNVEDIFQVYGHVWKWVHSYYDKYQQLPDKDKVARNFSEFEYINTEGSLQYYIDEAHRYINTAKIKDALVEAARLLKEDGPTAATNYLISTGTKLVKDTGKVKDTDLANDAEERVDKLREVVAYNAEGRTTLGISSGISVLDHEFGGFQESDLIVVLGYTGSKKSWFTRLLAVRAWEAGCRPMVVSLEMNKYQEGYRFDTLLNQGVNFRNSQLSHGRDIDPEDYAAWVKTQFDEKQPFYLVTNEGLETVDQNMIQAKIEQYHPDLVIVDHIGLMDDSHRGGNEVERIKNISKDLKRIAVRNQIPIINVSQATMEQGKQDQRAPELWETAWSRQIGFDADLVLSLFSQQDSNIIQVMCKKNRRGQQFAFNLVWNLDTGHVETDFTESI